MLDYVAIFTRGGILLWDAHVREIDCTGNINSFIRTVILEERRTDSKVFEDDNVAIQYRFDNESGTIFIAVYEKAVKLNYLDCLLTGMQNCFKEKYANQSKDILAIEYSFDHEFKKVLKSSEQISTQQGGQKRMRTFNDSEKSKKTVSSLMQDNKKPKMMPVLKEPALNKNKNGVPKNKNNSAPVTPKVNEMLGQAAGDNNLASTHRKLLEKFGKKRDVVNSKKFTEKSKQPRIWEFGGGGPKPIALDRSKEVLGDCLAVNIQNKLVGTMQGSIPDLEVDTEESETYGSYCTSYEQNLPATKSSHGLLSYFKGMVGSRVLNQDNLKPALEKMRDHLITKNVAADITIKLCDSVATSLEGKSIGTFDTVAHLVKEALHESLIRILTPKRRIDIVRDALESKKTGKPYVITFCGVNGVGKSTNLAKICFWLNENDFNVLIAACDTFRAGAVEQLRTHMRHLNALHSLEQHNRVMVQLYEKGYGKDAAGIAMEAIRHAKEAKFDIVLIDTAGRMQDNEPLMRSLSKLITQNNPDLVLFVGEALVGNEAVDQLVKFNQALADYSSNNNPHTIDGIVLTKFDVIDDKVGAAISMTYATGQPIVFVGTGQTYTDLRAINVDVIVRALMK